MLIHLARRRLSHLALASVAAILWSSGAAKANLIDTT